MKTLIFGAVAAIAVFVAMNNYSGNSNATSQDDSVVEASVSKVDSYLEQGLTPEAHDALARHAQETSEFLRGIRDKASEHAGQ